jgi:negative regulator of flagellin synthesis FlgM
MKIDDKMISYEVTGNLRGFAPDKADRTDKNKFVTGGKVEEGLSKGDTVVRLSQTSKDTQRIRDIVASQPEVREDKVASIREKIESGNYELDYKGIADKLVNAFIEDLI